MKKSIRTVVTSAVLALGLASTVGLSAPIAQAATTDDTGAVDYYQMPYVTQIETGNFYYEITKPIGYQTLSGISLLMLINPDGVIRNSKVKVTMSDGSVLLQYGTENAYYVLADQVKLYTNVR
ncbi:hypothetical protein [Companilactobacillus sp.]|jgi:hypothetical protein|uniref:hypothetical protein n=1 Tax=Companilactobacillus sp. TaxID=2767905 RepID=UPI0025C700CE|nr:hypothetical protein [Companilactobacillus sp.]MCH4008907.1 hypothetical protein [Companilactobacillus sp.]MCH4050914.1 hypothetical protein [Companilactobacillus sp.]MCH4076850.1 hypothetical protein [Companilactobacillus sp.]MCH4125425.1 hypothetical protein [Companilactobacillus sp.]MCH4131967.1 hypothetical protein [Companilactobacillus sp.]